MRCGSACGQGLRTQCSMWMHFLWVHYNWLQTKWRRLRRAIISMFYYPQSHLAQTLTLWQNHCDEISDKITLTKPSFCSQFVRCLFVAAVDLARFFVICAISTLRPALGFLGASYKFPNSSGGLGPLGFYCSLLFSLYCMCRVYEYIHMVR